MSRHWFGVNKVWGWYPSSWEGWIVLVGMVASIATTSFIVDSRSHSASDTLIGIFPFVSLTVAFTMVVATVKGAKPAFGNVNKHKQSFSPDNPRVYVLLPLVILPVMFYYLVNQSYLDASILFFVFLLLF